MIAILYDAERYREFLDRTVEEGSVVIEIGPHTGLATKRYVGRTEKTILVDKGVQAEEAMAKLKIKHPNLEFLRADARDFRTVAWVRKMTDCCDVLALDMGGGRFPDTVFKVWAIWSGVYKPRHSVIRNRGLAEFLQRARIEDSSLKKDFPESGWLSVWGRTVPSRLKKQMEEFNYWVDIAPDVGKRKKTP